MNSDLDYKIFNVRMRSFLHAYTPISVHSFVQRTSSVQ